MVAELSALQQIISALTGYDTLGLPSVLVEVFVTTVYTCKLDDLLLADADPPQPWAVSGYPF